MLNNIKLRIRSLFNPIAKKKVYPHPMALKEHHVRNCRLLINRRALLEHMPKDSICCEVGPETGGFSTAILNITRPKLLHLFEKNENFMQVLKEKFKEQISENRVILHLGDALNELKKIPDNYFDWAYVDLDMSYSLVLNALRILRLKVKENGIIAVHSYIFFSHTHMSKTGVIEAVNEFCNRYNYEVVFFALQLQTYHDIALRKIGQSSKDFGGSA